MSRLPALLDDALSCARLSPLSAWKFRCSSGKDMSKFEAKAEFVPRGASQILEGSPQNSEG